MQKILAKIDPETKQQLQRFLVVGLFVLIVDLLVYSNLVNVLEFEFTSAKAIAFISGSFTAYILNKFFTFSQKPYKKYKLSKFMFLYAMTFFANIASNDLMLQLTSQQVLISYFVATGISTTLNFFGQKSWVFNSHHSS